MTLSVAEALERVRVTRIVHFTPAKNLWGIFTDEMIRTSEDLAANADSYCVTDPERLDRRRTHTCCSFEYPNAYYQRKARSKTPLINYPDWVCLILNRELAKRRGTLFAPCNAAKNSGAFLAEGGQAVHDCWANPSIPNQYPRRPTHHPAVPTDLQAEVLIPGAIDLSECSAIVAATEGQARTLFGFLDSQDLRPERVEWRYAPMLFNAPQLTNAIHSGHDIPETVWSPEDDLK